MSDLSTGLRRAAVFLVMMWVSWNAVAQPTCVAPSALQAFTTQCDAFGQARLLDLLHCQAVAPPSYCGSIGILAEVRREPQRLICFWDGTYPPVNGGGYISGIPFDLPCDAQNLTISLSGTASTKFLPAGPVLAQTATVTQSGSPKAGAFVSVTIAGQGSYSGTTDASGQFSFNFVPTQPGTATPLTWSAGYDTL